MKRLLIALVAAAATTTGFTWADGWDDSPCGPEKAHCGKYSAPDCGSWCDDVEPFCGPTVFAAKGCETRKIKIGGHIAMGYQFIDVNDDLDGNADPDEYNNFLMRHIRLCVGAELGNGWSGLMNVDFAGKSTQHYGPYYTDNPDTAPPPELCKTGNPLLRSCDCQDQCKLYVNKAYIQKSWLDTTFRFGYQKVSWGVEETTAKENLKTIERSLATNFFTNLGRRATASLDYSVLPTTTNETHRTYDADRELLWAGQSLGGRHTGIFVAGQMNAFHYSAAVVNGYQGICMNSNFLNNELGFFASLAFEFGVDDMDLMLGVNAGYKTKGGNAMSIVNHNVYGVNPYLFMNWCRLSVMAEMFWGSVEDGKVTAFHGDADPWGFNFIPSYMLNDCWELVGRFSYVNTDEMGMTVHNAFGCTPDNGKRKVGHTGAGNPTFVASDVLFEKAYSGYIGLNYYLMNGAVKISAGLEQAKFKNRGNQQNIKNRGGDTFSFGDTDNKGLKVNAARANIQFLF